LTNWRTGSELGLGGRQRRRAQGQTARVVQPYDTLVPAAALLDELADRERIQELAGDQQRRPVRHAGQALVPVRPGVRQRRGLPGAQDGAGLDQMQLRGIARRRHGLGNGAQRVGHQRAAPGPQLDQPYRRGPTHGIPQRGAPQPDQLAVNLRDLGRGDEVALEAERVSCGVVAMARMAQRQCHVLGQTDRPLGGDQGADGPAPMPCTGPDRSAPRRRSVP